MHSTYSIRDILQSDIQPELCQQILNQIKSPLLQQSFILTTDDDRQPPRRGPKNQINSYMTPSYSRNVTNYDFEPTEYTNSILSPFHPDIQDQPVEYNPQIKSNFCGSVFDPLEQDRNQVSALINPMPFMNRIRRKIFTKKTHPFHSPISNLEKSLFIKSSRQVPKRQVTLSAAIGTLKSIDQKQICQFLSFSQKILTKLETMNLHQRKLSDNMLQVYKILAQSSRQSSFQTTMNNHRRVFNRLRVSNFAQVFNKIAKIIPSYGETIKLQSDMINAVEILEEAQQIIEEYVNWEGIVGDLKRVHKIISENPGSSLKQQLNNFLHSLSVYELDNRLPNLQYIWPTFNFQLIGEKQFIQSICRNDLIVRDSSASDYKYEEILSEKGFTRNA